MPACARASTSLIALEFWAVRSSSSLVLLMIGVVCSLTYFLLAQPTDATMLATRANANEVRFMCGGLLPLFLLALKTWDLTRWGVSDQNQDPFTTGGLFSHTPSEHEACQLQTPTRHAIRHPSYKPEMAIQYSSRCMCQLKIEENLYSLRNSATL